jgi:hypothetical protein
MMAKYILTMSTLATLALASSQPAGCPFTISSNGVFACPAGQLPDGQIRLNGNYSEATFYISDGSITDSEGKGCIITGKANTLSLF